MRDLVVEQTTIINTVGYEKTDIESYVRTLKGADIALLVDVRERPISRKRGFSKNKLREAVEAEGIEYVHIQQLGDPKPGRDAARAGNHDEFVKIFMNHMAQPETIAAARELATTIAGKKICLTCFERDHQCCHRTLVAEHLAELINADICHLKV